MDDVFGDQASQEEEAAQAAAGAEGGEGQQVEQVEGQPNANAETTAAQNTEKHVPLAALEAERRGRQDWKEKASRLEGELAELRRQTAERQQSPEQRQIDPIQRVEQMVLNERFNNSEMYARQKYADLDDMLTVFADAAKANPALSATMMQQANPYEYAYREAKRLQVLKEVGDDPAAYRSRVEAEIRAQIGQSSTPAQPNLPASLAGARSAAPRSAPAFTGPAPLGSIFGN